MYIAILGTGSMAKGLAQRFAASGYSIVLGSRDAERAHAVAAALGQGVQAASVRGAADAADVIVLAVPFSAARETIAAAGDLTGKTIIDITNPLTEDYSGLTIGHTNSAAEEVQRAAPGARVVKALNTVFASLLAEPIINGAPVTAFYAGDDEAANTSVRAILERAGFKPEFAGPLRNARYLEPVAGLNIVLGYGLGGGTSIAPEWRRAA
jgi:8-hydroxy-5-deazaflavin:NADPH oxidoreductase